MNRRQMLLLMGRKSLEQRINNWQNSQSSLIHAAGYEQALWENFSVVNGEYTWILTAKAFRQHGYVKQIVLRRQDVDAGTGYKFKTFRWNGATSKYDMISEQAIVVSAGTGVKTINLTPVLVQPGDVPGIYIPNVTTSVGSDTNTTAIRYAAGDITTPNAFTSTASRTLQIELLMLPPYLAVTGDSIPEGHNTVTPNHGGLHSDSGTNVIPWYVPTSEIAAQIRSSIGGGDVMMYQNLARGSQTYAWVASTGAVQSVAVKPNTIYVLAGVNDINTGRTWANIEGNLDSIKALITTEKLLISEILPWTAGTDANAATIRSFNGSLATWCAANGATLVLCHDTMGMIRASTGEIDDLNTAYDYDGVHLTATGVVKMAQIIKGYL